MYESMMDYMKKYPSPSKKVIKRFNYYIKNWINKQTIKLPEHTKKFKQNTHFFLNFDGQAFRVFLVNF